MEYLDGLEMYIVKNIEGLEREDEWKEKGLLLKVFVLEFIVSIVVEYV